MSLFNRNARNANVIRSINAGEKTVQLTGQYVNPVFNNDRRQPTMTVEANKALELPANSIAIFTDFIDMGEEGRKMAYYSTEARALVNKEHIIVTSFRKAYERVFNPGFNARFLDEANFLNLKNLGRGLRLMESYNIFRADEAFQEQFRAQLEGASDVIVFISKTSTDVVRVVRFDGYEATVYQMVQQHNRDIGARSYVSKVYLSAHPVIESDEKAAASWNAFAAEKEINAQVDPKTLVTKYEFAAYMAEGIKIVVSPMGFKVKDLDVTTGQINERWANELELHERFCSGYTMDNGTVVKGKLQHIVDGYRRQAASDAGLRAEDFKAAAE